MRLKQLTLTVASVALLLSVPGSAQVAADLVAGPGIGGPGPEAPHTPAGTAIIGNNIWVGDEVQGFRHYIPVDPNSTAASHKHGNGPHSLAADGLEPSEQPHNGDRHHEVTVAT